MSFRDDFLWGAATAAYQIEGAVNEDGRGLSIWDVYTKMVGRVHCGENGDVACDHYHRYKEDVALMKEMGLKAYRFSISWPRVIPTGKGVPNEKGLQFYESLVDELIANDIEPVCTLFHWDYPYDLECQGGWMNPESSEWFLEYTKLVIDRLGDKIRYWVTFNEPQCFIGNGYQNGKHAPFQQRPVKDLITMTHNVHLAHGKAVKYIREHGRKDSQVGFSPTGPVYIPEIEEGMNEQEKAAAIKAARDKSMIFTGAMFNIVWWSDPIFFGKYPDAAYEMFGEDMPVYPKEEMDLISQPLDFYGANIYFHQYDFMKMRAGIEYAEGFWQGREKNAIGWPISPEVFYWSPKFLYERYKKPVIVMENGYAGNDLVCMDGKVHDAYRVDTMHRYLKELKRAAEDQIEIAGYFAWSFMDNFEWELGYDPRFGLVHVDYRTQKRTPKDSYYWYAETIKENGENL